VKLQAKKPWLLAVATQLSPMSEHAPKAERRAGAPAAAPAEVAASPEHLRGWTLGQVAARLAALLAWP